MALKSLFGGPDEGPDPKVEAPAELAAQQRIEELRRSISFASTEISAELAKEARRLAEERRRELREHEQRAASDLSARLLQIQQRVDERLQGWTVDLERVQGELESELARLEERQRKLIAQVEARLVTNAERLTTDGEEQRAAVLRLREELERSVRDAIQAAGGELEELAAERRRALHEVAERLRRRERELRETIEREETELQRRLEARFAEVERRQVERLERSLSREADRFADAAAQRFEEAIKAAREEAARRLSRELERAVAAFAREGERVLAERLTVLGRRPGEQE
jgi:chromosome segregation ATPase